MKFGVGVRLKVNCINLALRAGIKEVRKES